MTTRIFERTSIVQRMFSSIAADSTGGGPIEIVDSGVKGSHAGILREVKVECSSTDYSISLRAKSNALAGSIDEIHTKSTINLNSSETGLSSHWVNGDEPVSSTIYLVLVNSDSGNATGPVNIQIATDINRPFAKNK